MISSEQNIKHRLTLHNITMTHQDHCAACNALIHNGTQSRVDIAGFLKKETRSEAKSGMTGVDVKTRGKNKAFLKNDQHVVRKKHARKAKTSNHGERELSEIWTLYWDRKGSQVKASFHLSCWRALERSRFQSVRRVVPINDTAATKRVTWEICEAPASSSTKLIHDLCQAGDCPAAAVLRICPLTNPERKLIKQAAATAEYHDSQLELKRKASRIAQAILRSKNCIIFTGAGISTSAGIGDYRGLTGKWTKQDWDAPEGGLTPSQNGGDASGSELENKKEDGGSDEQPVAEDEALNVGGGTSGGAMPFENLRPTYTHEALKKLMDMGLLKAVISQNCDGLHHLSGIPQDKLFELHGNVFKERCEQCGHVYMRPHYTLDDDAGRYMNEVKAKGQSSLYRPPHASTCLRCGVNHRTGRKCDDPRCGGHLCDSIIHFGDDLWEDNLEGAQEVASQADLVLSLGTTMMVTPASSLVTMGKKRPLSLVICNRQTTPLDYICETGRLKSEERQIMARQQRIQAKKNARRKLSDGQFVSCGDSVSEDSYLSDESSYDSYSAARTGIATATVTSESASSGDEDLAPLEGKHPSPGVRVFGDCDDLMREVMRLLLSDLLLNCWERGTFRRGLIYDQHRLHVNPLQEGYTKSFMFDLGDDAK
jgi:mono-ADP-ribosyltransferase sirtuin 6